MKTFACSLLVLLAIPLLALCGTAQAQSIYYRFALPNPAVNCTTSQGKAAAVTMSTPVEWNAIPPASSINAYSILNDSVTLAGNYSIAPGTGSQVFAGITYLAPSFPFTAGIRYDTLAAGSVVYRSTILVSCTAAGVPGTSQITNETAVLERTPALSAWALLALGVVIALLAIGTTRPRVKHRSDD